MRSLLAGFFICFCSLVAVAQGLPGAKAHFTDNKTTPDKESSLVISTNLVSLTVTVTDSEGRHVAGLDRSAFAVLDDRVAQEIAFFSGSDEPASVGIVFDLSGSMSGGKIVAAKEALARFVETGHPDDDYALVVFNDHADLALEHARGSEALLARLSSARAGGNTALYDAISLALAAVSRGAYHKRALVIISDGEDNRSRLTSGDLHKQLREAGAVVYSIGIGGTLPRSIGPYTLDKLASTSGGKYFAPKNADEMSEVFERIALELRHQYSIGYSPSNFIADGKWHRVKVHLTPPPEAPRLVVRARQGYYAPLQ